MPADACDLGVHAEVAGPTLHGVLLTAHAAPYKVREPASLHIEVRLQWERREACAWLHRHERLPSRVLARHLLHCVFGPREWQS
jgi:hypothetical protein